MTIKYRIVEYLNHFELEKEVLRDTGEFYEYVWERTNQIFISLHAAREQKNNLELQQKLQQGRVVE